MTKRNMPWSLKGVSLEARDAARASAQREGLTIGAWLDRAIRTAASNATGATVVAAEAAPVVPAPPAPDPVQTPADPAAEPTDAPEAAAADGIEAALLRLERHLTTNEERAAAALAPLERSVGSLLDRVEAVERRLAEDEPDA